ncbi:MAG: hypothetical protein WCH58_03565 [Candidatus Saccharibacteria bacterium]
MGFSLFNFPTKVSVSKSELIQITGVGTGFTNEIIKILDELKHYKKIDKTAGWNIQIDIPKDFRHHIGLGLTTQITSAVVIAAAETYGIKMDYVDLFNLGIGRVSSLGLSAIFSPGFMIEFGYKLDKNSAVNIHPDLYKHTESPSGALLRIDNFPWKAVIAIPKNLTSLSGKIEDSFWNDIFPDKVESSKDIAYAVSNYILPALISNDFDNFIKGLNIVTQSGTKPAEESIQNQNTKDMANKLREKLGFASISSLGPVIYSFTDKTYDIDTIHNLINDEFDIVLIDTNRPNQDVVHLDIPTKIIRDNQQKYYLEDKNIPFDTLSQHQKYEIKILDSHILSKTKIIASFACLGKTYFANKYPHKSIDLESLSFRYVHASDDESMKCDSSLIHDSAFPANYVKQIIDCIGKYEYIFIVLSIPALKILDCYGIEYTVVYPDKTMTNTILNRAKIRGNNDEMLSLLKTNLSNEDEYKLMKSILKSDKYILATCDDNIENLIHRGII